MKFIVSLIMMLCFASLPVLADIYRFVDKYGNVHLTDRKKSPAYKRIILTNYGRVRPENITPGKRGDFVSLVDSAAHRYGLNQELIHAVIENESSYDKKAVSRAGAMGLMQLMPETARNLGVSNPFDARQNINGGSKLLSTLIAKYQNLRVALAAYNAGETAVNKYGGNIPPFPETQRYVKKVVTTFRKNLSHRKTYSR